METVTVGSWLTKKLFDFGFNKFVTKITPDQIDSKFKQAIRQVSSSLESKYPHILGGNIESFFLDKEIFSELFKILFKQAEINIEIINAKFDTSSLPDKFIEEFVLELRKVLLEDHFFHELLSDKEIFIAIVGLEENAEKIASYSQLTNQEVVRMRRFLEDRISDGFNYDDFITRYKNAGLNNLSQVNFLGLGISQHINKNRKNIFDIFVEPKLQPYDRQLMYDMDGPISFDNEIEIKQLLSDDKVVVLGNPGAGKSILVRYIMCLILQIDDIDYIPFRMELKNYVTYKKENHCGIISYLRTNLEVEYGLIISESKLLELFENKKSLVFFDGLDEIFDINDKIQIKNDIENFADSYESSKILVTSRLIGYEDAQFNHKFKEFVLVDFDDNQIEEYIIKWYKIEEPNEAIRIKEINEFMTMTPNLDEELLGNPLLLSLIVILYRHNRELPNSRLEIYRSCAKTLVDKWDENKKLNINLEKQLLKAKEKILANLAYWQYETMNSDKRITNKIVTNKVMQIILQLKVTEDELEAYELAEDFMDYAKKRSIYFDNNFTHKTFLEYYTAFRIYQNHFLKGNINEIHKIVRKYVNEAYWYIVLELLINMIDENQGDNDIIDGLINSTTSEKNSKYFFLGILPSISNVSSIIVKNLIKEAIIEFLQMRLDLDNVMNVRQQRTRIPRLRQLINIDRYNPLVQSALNEVHASYPECSLNWHIFFFELNRNRLLLKNEYLYELEELIVVDSYLAVLDMVYNDMNIDKIKCYIANFGIYSLTDDTFKSFYTARKFGNPIRHYIIWQFAVPNLESLEENLSEISSCGLDISLIVRSILRAPFVGVLKFPEVVKKVAQLLGKTESYECYVVLLAYLHKLRKKAWVDDYSLWLTEASKEIQSGIVKNIVLDIIDGNIQRADLFQKFDQFCNNFSQNYRLHIQELKLRNMVQSNDI